MICQEAEAAANEAQLLKDPVSHRVLILGALLSCGPPATGRFCRGATEGTLSCAIPKALYPRARGASLPLLHPLSLPLLFLHLFRPLCWLTSASCSAGPQVGWRTSAVPGSLPHTEQFSPDCHRSSSFLVQYGFKKQLAGRHLQEKEGRSS